MTEKKDKPITVIEWLGFKPRPNLAAHRTIGGFVGTLVTLLVLVTVLPAIVATVVLIWDVMLHPSEATSLRTGALIAAILSAPLIIWRTMVAAKQAAIQEEGLFNDKINAAAEGLAARRQLTRVVGRGAKMQVLTEWQDDLVTRASAIDRLEGLAVERRNTAARVARMLSIYVRELSREYPAQKPPVDATPRELREWANKLTPIRPDMEKAAQSLGRLQRIKGHDIARGDIDLSHANLQGFDLQGLTFENALFQGAKMQGADLSGAEMQGANLWRAQMQEVSLSDAEMQGANLTGAGLQRADLIGVTIQGANLWGAEMQWAFLTDADMQRAELWGAKMQGADLGGAKMQGADLWDAKMQGADLRDAKMDEYTDLSEAILLGAALGTVDEKTITHLRDFWGDIFADGTVQVPEGARPDHWAVEELGWNDFLTRWHAWQDTLPDFDHSWRRGW